VLARDEKPVFSEKTGFPTLTQMDAEKT